MGVRFGKTVTEQVQERGWEQELAAMNRVTKLMQVPSLILES
jgi:hypothetical protein